MGSSLATAIVALSGASVVLAAATDLPTEFRLFQSGWNETENGRYLFDREAAAATMAAYNKWGVELAIDLEHQMLDDEPTPDPTAKDARGWCCLELRGDGSLWAVNVRWTDDGAARLTQKRQRYVSPAFAYDTESLRISQVVNVAITSIPATHNTPALVAARKQISKLASGDKTMDPKLVQAALEALINGDQAKCEELLKQIVAQAAGAADPDKSTEDAPPPAGDGGSDEATEAAKNAPPPPAPTADDKKKDAPPAVAAASAKLMRLTNATSIVDAVDMVETFRASHLTLEGERQKLATERATLESAERRKLCVELVQLSAEYPSTIWTDDKATTLKARWLAMPIAELRAHVGDQRTARNKKAPTSATQVIVPPPATELDAHGLDERELKICKELKCEPEVFARLKKQRTPNTAV